MKIKIKDIYHFQVVGEILAGKRVYALDKLLCYSDGAILLNSLPMWQAHSIIEAASKDESGRFVFWVTEREGKV